LLPGDHRVLEGLARIGYDFAREWTAKELLARPITVIGDEPAVDVFTVAWTVNYEQAVRGDSGHLRILASRSTTTTRSPACCR
jgi:hypothetical protein